MTLYGILDDFNEVIRWIDYKPSSAYRYIVKRIPKRKAIDWATAELAPF